MESTQLNKVMQRLERFGVKGQSLGWLQPIGIDFGARCIKVCQLQKSEKPGELRLVTDAAVMPQDLPTDREQRIDALSGLLDGVLSAHPFVGKRVVVCVSNGMMEFRNIRIPPMPAQEMAAAVDWEIANRPQLKRDGNQYQSVDAGDVWENEDRLREIILMAGNPVAVQDCLDVLTRCGLTPVAIDAAPLALTRCFSPANEAADAPPVMLLDVGFSSSVVQVMQGGHLRFVRRLELGCGGWDELVAQQLSVTPAQAEQMRMMATQANAAGDSAGNVWAHRSHSLEQVNAAVDEAAQILGNEFAKSLVTCLRYFSVTFRQRRPESGLIIGGAAHEKQLIQIIGAKAGLELHAASDWPALPAGQLAGGAPTGGVPSTWAIAAGLALYGKDEATSGNAPMSRVNFLPRTYVQARARRRFNVGYSALVGTLLVAMGLAWLGTRYQMHKLETEVRDLRPKAVAAEQHDQELAKVNAQKRELERFANTRSKLEPALPTTSVVAAIGQLLPNSMGLTRLAFTGTPTDPSRIHSQPAVAGDGALPSPPPPPLRIEMAGLAPRDEDLALFVRGLSAHKLFTHVKLVYSRPTTAGDLQAREFSVEAEIPLTRRYVPAQAALPGAPQEVARGH